MQSARRRGPASGFVARAGRGGGGVTAAAAGEPMIPATACARCGLDVAAHRVERDGVVFCTAFCARAAASAQLSAAAPSAEYSRDAPTQLRKEHL
jgi:hypothetical protein